MSSRLETIPHDILEHLAFVLAVSSIAEPLHDLSSLRLTSSKINQSLSRRSCPHLYASIFRAAFDVDATLHAQLTDSALGLELLQRHRVLRLIRRRDSASLKTEELWAVLRMVLEDKTGLNLQRLSAEGFLDFIISLLNDAQQPADDEAHMLGMWILCFTLTHADVTEMPATTREELRRSLRFPIAQSASPVPHFVYTPNGLDEIRDSMVISAAIIITFALNEAYPLTIPPHIPQTRAIAVATRRNGPTVEDFLSIVHHRTPLFADLRRDSGVRTNAASLRSAMSDPVLGRLLRASYKIPAFPLASRECSPGSLTGIWEGSFMLCCPSDTPSSRSIIRLEDFQCLKPMQIAVTEYFCFSPHLPLSLDYPSESLESVIHSHRFGYDKFSKGWPRDPSEALDVIILGETLPDHQQAWPGFRFAGRLHADGLVSLVREPKDQNERQFVGNWVMEGRLRYGCALVGDMRSCSGEVVGIFSLHKTKETW